MSESVEPEAWAASRYGRALSRLTESGVPVLVGGAYAMRVYAGISRWTKDLDLFSPRSEVARVLAVLEEDGWEVELTDPVWLAKARLDGLLIDVLFSSGNGLHPVEESWFQRAAQAMLFGAPVRLLPVEEMILVKAYVQTRDRYDGADIHHLILKHGQRMDWKRLLDLLGAHWEVLLAHLVNFRFVYPSEHDAVPEWLWRDLLRRAQEQIERPPVADRICRGTLFSRSEYEIDVREWGYRDTRADFLLA